MLDVFMVYVNMGMFVNVMWEMIGFCMLDGNCVWIWLIVLCILFIVFCIFFLSWNLIIVVELLLLMVDVMCLIVLMLVMLFLILCVILVFICVGVVFGRLVVMEIVGKLMFGKFWIDSILNDINFVIVIRMNNRIDGIGLWIV